MKLPSVGEMVEDLPTIFRDSASTATAVSMETKQIIEDICTSLKNTGNEIILDEITLDVFKVDRIATESDTTQESIDGFFELYPTTAPGTSLSDTSQNSYDYFPQNAPEKPPNDFTSAQLDIIRKSFFDVAIGLVTSCCAICVSGIPNTD